MTWWDDDCGCMYIKEGTAQVWTRNETVIAFLVVDNATTLLTPNASGIAIWFEVPENSTVLFMIASESVVNVMVRRYGIAQGTFPMARFEPLGFSVFLLSLNATMYELDFVG